MIHKNNSVLLNYFIFSFIFSPLVPGEIDFFQNVNDSQLD